MKIKKKKHEERFIKLLMTSEYNKNLPFEFTRFSGDTKNWFIYIYLKTSKYFVG